MAAVQTRAGWASWVNLVLGIWLIISAFVWPHSAAAQTNTWILGIIIAVFALASFAVPALRWVNIAAAAWLFFSSFAIPHQTVGTLWNNAIVAIVVFVVAISAALGTPERSMTRTVRA